MLKILIVDDEPLVRMGLKSTLARCENTNSVVVEAANGRKAIEILEQETVDIVFTDIKMPEMNGIELIRWIRENRESIKIVVLSCFSDFEYVREAFKHGITDYILKYDVEVQNIAYLMDKITHELSGQQAQQDQGTRDNHDAAEKYQSRRALLKELFYHEHTDDSPEFSNQLIDHGINLQPEMTAVVICIEIDHLGESVFSSQDADDYALELEIKNILEEYLQAAWIEVMRESQSRFIALLCIEDRFHFNGDTVMNRLNQVQNVFRKYLNCPVSISASQPGPGDAVNRLFAQALLGIERKFYAGEGYLGIYNPDELPERSNSAQLVTKKNDVIKQINEGSLHNILASLVNLKVGFESALVKSSDVKLTYISLLEAVKDHFCAELNELGPGTVEMLQNDISGFSSLEAINSYLADVITNLSNTRIGTAVRDDYSAGVAKCIEYINTHYSDEKMSLAQLSSLTSYSQAYLSRIFKKETGHYLADYINEVRIGHAKRLLANPKNKIYQVAEKVGYANYSYFSKMFRKITGKSPSEYSRP